MGLQRLATTWALFQALLVEAMPFLLIGVAIATLARWLSPGGRWVRKLPSQPLLGPLSGAALGFALPACECGNVPVARRLLASGAPLGAALGFLFAAPVLNPIVLASTWAAFPDKPWLLLARPLGAVVVAVALATLLGQRSEALLLTPELLEERRLSQPLSQVSLLDRRSGLIGSQPPTPLPADVPVRRQPLAEVLGHGSSEFLGLALLLVFGCLIAALVQTVLPRSWLLAVGGAPTLSILSLMLLSLVVSVCSSVDAFLALGFAAQVTPGALLAFLLLGPVIDLKLIGLFGVLLRPRAILLTAAGAGLVVLLIGQWANLILL
ncbi:permease [Synechococcus sp. CS-602]|nr:MULTISPECIES: permease [Synechococcaceae]MCT0201661.1 permease [Synechococcus sp. CS-603]MCT0203528.1 permease [Synechococcus sp. CS-602]MCT4363836.1 permease [Candidatus Regnicoccus frigidus MAG-AL1]MCT4366089.1 permease [Candidatus Regnicoccus frigidus MAG-AL2]